MRRAFSSTASTFTFTICPVFTASLGSLMNLFESSLMCTSPSLMHPDIHESPELCHVRYHAFEHHPCFHVADLAHLFMKSRRHERIARIAPRLAQFAENVVERERSRLHLGTIHLRQQLRMLDHLVYPRFEHGGDLLHHRVGLGMHGGAVQRIISVANAQKSRRLLEGLRPDA